MTDKALLAQAIRQAGVCYLNGRPLSFEEVMSYDMKVLVQFYNTHTQVRKMRWRRMYDSKRTSDRRTP